MKRRTFIAGLGSAAASLPSLPLAVRAQQPTLPVIGFLGSQTKSEGAPVVAAFRQGLADSGYVERQNVEILYRWSEGQVDHFPALVADLVRRRVAVIAAPGGGTELRSPQRRRRRSRSYFQSVRTRSNKVSSPASATLAATSRAQPSSLRS
jgi:hypothetical protein